MPEPTKRYRSNIRTPRDLEPAFQHAIEMSTYRNPPGHTVLCDPEFFLGCGYATHDEAALLYEIARRGPSEPWLEIGGHTGWTAAHLALADRGVVSLDPEYSRPGFNYTKDPARFLARAEQNVREAGLDGLVTFVGKKSAEYADEFEGEEEFGGVFVDGEHEPPFPLRDAEIALRFLRLDTKIVVFHDAVGRPVQAAIRFLIDKGFKFRLYRTPQYLGVCWSGNFEPPDHDPDPTFDFDRYLANTKFDRELLDLDARFRL